MVFQNRFDAGELDKWCLGAVDDPAYQRGCAWLENFNLIRTGGINRRKGFKLVERVLEIRAPEYRKLDAAGGAEILREADAETPGVEGNLRRADTMFGTSESLVKLIPLSYSGNKNYLVYLLAQKYGYIEFRGFEMVRKAERDWPPEPYVSAGNTFAFRRDDPDAHWKITGISSLASGADLSGLPALGIGGAAVIEQAQVKITGMESANAGKLLAAEDFIVTPKEINPGSLTLTQDGKGGTVSWFDEKGAGTGLKLSCRAAAQTDKTVLSFTILESGEGFVADDGKTTTMLSVTVDGVGTVLATATVGTAGQIMSVNDYKMDKYPLSASGRGVMRFFAPPIAEDIYSDITDWKDSRPTAAATLRAKATKTEDDETRELGASYRIEFVVEVKGAGFDTAREITVTTGNDKDGKPVTEARKITFLKIRCLSDVGGERCGRELRVCAYLDNNGGIKEVKPIPFWIDDDLAAYRAAEAAPGEAGGCFDRLMSAGRFNEADGAYEDGSGAEENVMADGSVTPPPVKFVAGVPASGPPVILCSWKGIHYYGYTESEIAKIDSYPSIKVIQEFAGTWYEKAFGVWKNNGGSNPSVSPGRHPCGRTLGFYASYHNCYNEDHQSYRYPLNHALSYPLTGGNSAPVSNYEYDASMAGGCPMLVSGQYSAQPYLQWFEGGQRKYAPYANPLKAFLVSGLKFNFLPPLSARRANKEPNYVMFSAFSETGDGTYPVSKAEAWKGTGAEIRVASAYSKPDNEFPYGKITLTLSIPKTGTVETSGKDYLGRDVDGVVLRLAPREGGYAYEVPVKAARGAGGALVLRNPDGTAASSSGKAVYTVAAELEKVPPETGGNMLLSNKDGVTASAKCAVTANYDTDGSVKEWIVRTVIGTMADGEPLTPAGFAKGEALTAGWTVGNRAFTAASKALSVFAVKTWNYILSGGGKFKTDPKGSGYYGSYGGKSYSLYITGSGYVSGTRLFITDDGKPRNGVAGQLYKVLEDEELNGNASYWRWDLAAFVPAALSVFPSSDKTISGLQYAYTGAYLVFCGSGITPFTLKIKGADIELGTLVPKTEVEVEVIAPAEFGLEPANSVEDGAVPALFMRTQNASPSVVAYINGRLWAAGVPDDPSRIYVSKPNRDKNSAVFDFTTYKITETVTPEITPFQASNAMGENGLADASEGVMGLASDYSGTPVRGKKIHFGYDKARILATPYFSKGATVESVTDKLVLSAASVAVAGEYTASEAAKLRGRAALYIGLCKTRVVIPGAFCCVTADCDGFEISVSSGAQIIGLTNSVGPVPGGGGSFRADWGSSSGRAAVIASAAVAAVSMCGGGLIAMAAVGGSSAGILAAAQGVVDAVIKGMLNSLALTLTNGSGDNPGMGDYGADYPCTPAIQAKCDYLLAKNKLYEPKQPFVMSRWKVEESEYSTPDCGFTFKASSDEIENISFITDLRSIFFSTDAGERIMPSTVNGAAQSAQSGSFFGSEPLQAAKAADALYFVQKGGQSLMRAYYAPNVPVPQIADAQMYNREILRGRKILGVKSAKSLPVAVWCLMEDGSPAVLTDDGGKLAWSRVSSGAGAVLDTGVIPVNGMPAMRVAGVRAEDGIYIGMAAESPGGKDDVYLDLWREYNDARLAGEYGVNAVVYDSVSGETVPASGAEPPEPGEGKYIGYPYTSRMRTMPVAAARAMKPGRVARVRLRLLESHLPWVKGHPSGMENRIVSPAWESVNLPRDGIADVPVPGNIELDASLDIHTSEPAALSIICLATEEDA